ncbi:hypothetical protein HK105_201476 [Polyrhizophydium stewartii]|uniref:Ribosomal RNA-processing protein 7 n=1 Tax=Polyrhizophydium stewartii TaxID=2732419 RepID=A0ABR4NIB5_9FUNG|nr:Ribosomal RNA-processing protein 7 [Polyrhizophydium stewartii]
MAKKSRKGRGGDAGTAGPAEQPPAPRAAAGPRAVEAAQPKAATEAPDSGSRLPAFAGFTVLPITVPPPTVLATPTLSLQQHMSRRSLADADVEHPATTHYIFMRAHASRGGDAASLPAGRTLFLVNLPADTNIMHLRRLFRRCGVIERVVWRGSVSTGDGAGAEAGAAGESASVLVSETLVQRTRAWVRPIGSHAHVVFEDDESVERVLAMKPRRRLWSDKVDNNEDAPGAEDPDDTTSNPLGISKWVLQHAAMFPDTSSLQTQVDHAMALFEDAEERARRELESRHNVPDEDGFVLVTRGAGRRNMHSDGHGASVGVARADEAKSLKPKEKGLVDFYRFQKRENKRNQLADLRRKFEEDKAKIATLKTKRRFRPY